METLKLTRADFDENLLYCGPTDVSDYSGHLEIAEGLGWVRFSAGLNVLGEIVVGLRSGIEAGGGIKAALTIGCKLTLSAKFSIFAGICTWRETTAEDRIVRAKEVRGEVAYGTVELISDAAPKA